MFLTQSLLYTVSTGASGNVVKFVITTDGTNKTLWVRSFIGATQDNAPLTLTEAQALIDALQAGVASLS